MSPRDWAPGTQSFVFVFTKTAEGHNLVEVIVIQGLSQLLSSPGQ